MLLAQLFLPCCQSFPPLPTSKLGPTGTSSRIGGPVYVLGPCASLQMNSPVKLEVSPPNTTSTDFYSQRFEALVSPAGTLGCVVRLVPQLLLLVYLQANVGPPAPLGLLSCHMSSLPQLPISAPPTSLGDVSSLTLWLSDFYTVQFSGSSACCCF